jgi:hypothetical protein
MPQKKIEGLFTRAARQIGLEHFHKSCSEAELDFMGAVFLDFGFVSDQFQGYSNLRLRQSLAKIQKSSLRLAPSFLSML